MIIFLGCFESSTTTPIEIVDDLSESVEWLFLGR
jgi:hypothetical protein